MGVSVIRWFAAVPFGTEGLCSQELRALGLAGVAADTGRVFFEGEPAGALAANLWLRTAERVYLQAGRFTAVTFEELFQGVVAIPWEDLVPPDGRLPVRAQCARSRLMSPSDCQKILKKAIAERFRRTRGLARLPETGAACAVSLWLSKDEVVLGVDASGEALHKRGYRLLNHEAPLRETLAAAVLLSSSWRPGVPLHDPMCGSGTLLIEAALIAARRAPGLSRAFAMEGWPMLEGADAERVRRQAREAALPFCGLAISGSDVDPQAIGLCAQHLRNAGLAEAVAARVCDAAELAAPGPSGFYIANPPYGERLDEGGDGKAALAALRALQERSPGWSMAFLTPYPGAERLFGRVADKRRRFYNGRLECTAYEYRARAAL